MPGRRALFLDRDGVINVDHGYVFRPEDFELIEGIFNLCRAAQARGYLIIVITNQAGIGRGYYTEDQFHRLNDWMIELFLQEGVTIDDVYFCPFHPEHGIGPYKADAPCRKPNPGMIIQAADEHAIDLSGSVLVGDKQSDVGAGLAAGVGKVFLYRPAMSTPLASRGGADVVTVDHLTEVTEWLVSSVPVQKVPLKFRA